MNYLHAGWSGPVVKLVLHDIYFQDLSKLNRDLSKVIFIEVDPKAAQLNPENVLLVPEWKGNMDDTALVDLAELLKSESSTNQF